MEALAVQCGPQPTPTGPEYVFLFAVYLISVFSLSDEECRSGLHRAKSDLLAEFQMLCEEATVRNNLLCISDIVLLKALTLYVVITPFCSHDRQSSLTW